MNATAVYAALGLSRNPFPPTPDAGSYFFTAQLEEELTELAHCIDARKGFVLVTGEVGLGKSTLVRRLLDTLSPDKCHSALILNTFLQGDALLAAIQSDFGLTPACDVESGLAQLTQFLLRCRDDGTTCLLVVDDAQNLSVTSLELIRLLCNLETGQEKLLQIMLVGQPELEQTLAAGELRQLKSRIIKHTRLRGLNQDDLARYFDFRVNAVGGRLTLQPRAAAALWRATQGNPRHVHLVLDRCLYGLASLRQSVVCEALVKLAVADLPDIGVASPISLGRSAHSVCKGLSRSKVVMGVLLGSATLVAAAAWALGVQPVSVAGMAVASPVSAPEPATTAAAPTAGTAPALPAPVVAMQAVASLPESPRQRCASQLMDAGGVTADVLLAHRLPSGAAPERFKPSATHCFFEEDGHAWGAWVSRGAAEQILLAQQATRGLQGLLQSRGLLDMPAPDGMLGQKTSQALAVFQYRHHLVPTGQPDEMTLFLLENLDVAAR